eukprot:2774080-Pyramimonas_sp.AAC.3
MQSRSKKDAPSDPHVVPTCCYPMRETRSPAYQTQTRNTNGSIDQKLAKMCIPTAVPRAARVPTSRGEYSGATQWNFNGQLSSCGKVIPLSAQLSA